MDILNKILETELYITSFNVNPNESLIFWSEYSGIFNGTHSYGNSIIVSSNQDGRNQKILRSDGLGLVFWINQDFISRRLFWYDYQFNSLGSMDFNGNHFRVIYESMNMVFVDHYSSFDLFNNYIYYCCKELNTTSRTICKIDVNERDISESFDIIDRDLKVRLDFHVIDQSNQPDSDDRCLNSNCSDLCLPINVTHYRCVCQKSKQNDSCIESVSHTKEYMSTRPILPNVNQLIYFHLVLS